MKIKYTLFITMLLTLTSNAEEINDVSNEINTISEKMDDIIHTLNTLAK